MTLQTGYNFIGGDQVTHTKLNNAVNLAVISGLDRNAFGSSSKIVTVGVGKPLSPTAGELAYDTSEAELAVFTGSGWVGISPRQEIAIDSTAALTAGDVVVQDAGFASRVTTTTTVGHTRVFGVASVASGAGNSARIQTSGIVTVNCGAAVVNIGDRLGTSATLGKAASLTSGGAAFAIALTVKDGNGAVQALLLGAHNPSSNLFTTSFTTYSLTGASLTDGQWYDFPGSAVGAAVTQNNGATAMKTSFTTTRPNQPVSVVLKDISVVTNNAALRPFDGFRVGVDSTSTILAGWTRPAGVTSDPGAGLVMSYGPVFTWQNNLGTNYGIRMNGWTGRYEIANAGAHTLFVQFLAGATASYTLAQETTATIAVTVEYD